MPDAAGKISGAGNPCDLSFVMMARARSEPVKTLKDNAAIPNRNHPIGLAHQTHECPRKKQFRAQSIPFYRPEPYAEWDTESSSLHLISCHSCVSWAIFWMDPTKLRRLARLSPAVAGAPGRQAAVGRFILKPPPREIRWLLSLSRVLSGALGGVWEINLPEFPLVRV
jgi:hypothetical protein